MRLLRLLVVLSVLTLSFVTPCLAQGTAVYRGEFPWTAIWWNDYEITNIVVQSSDPGFDVDGICYGNWPEPATEWKLVSYHELYLTPSGKDNYWIKGPVFTRVYGNFSSPLDPGGSFFSSEWWCNLLQGNEGELLAEGISEYDQNDINTCHLGPGQNTWDIRARGHLYASPTVCPSGIAKLDFTFHYMLTKDAYVDPATCTVDDPAHIRLVAIRGPNLKCIGK